MNNKIQVFNNDQFGQIRTVLINGEVHFIGRDVAIALGYTNSRKAIIDHVDDEDKGVTKCDTLGGEQELTMINESGLYSLILSSKLPQAKTFKHWITHDVIPSIRRTGSYSANVPQSFAEALQLAADQQRQIEQQQKQLAEQKPKVEFFNTVAESKTAIEMKEAANVLDFDKVGRNKLFQILRDNHLLTRKNQPYQKYIECGYFRTIEQKWERPDGDIVISIKTLVYQQGVEYIRKLLLKLGYKPHKKEE